MQITEELLKRLEGWKRKGDRMIEISFNRNDEVWNIWAFDYSLAAGMFLREMSDVDKIDALMIEKKKKQLLDELAMLDSKVPSNEMAS